MHIPNKTVLMWVWTIFIVVSDWQGKLMILHDINFTILGYGNIYMEE